MNEPQRFMLNSLMYAEEEQRALMEMEQAKRQGYNYIHIVSDGDIDRIHSIDVVKLSERPHPVTRRAEYVPREDTGILEFKENPITKIKEADILDTEYNRFFLARHIPYGLRVTDEKIRNQIVSLVDKEYKVDMNREDTIKRQIKQLERELKRERNIRYEEEQREKDRTAGVRVIANKIKNEEPPQVILPEDTEEGI